MFRNKKLGLMVAGAALAVALTGIGFAHTYAAVNPGGTVKGEIATVTANVGTGGPIGQAEGALTASHQGVPSTVPQGDLFLIQNTNDYSGDVNVIVDLTNTGALQNTFGYLNADVAVYYNAGTAQAPNWTKLDDQYLTLQNGEVVFRVPGSDYLGQGNGSGELAVSVIGGDFNVIQAGSYNVGYAVRVNPATGNA